MGLMKRFRGGSAAAASSDVDRAWSQLVGRSPVLYGLPEDTLAELSSHLEVVKAKAGEVIIEQGEPGDAFYLIVEGQAAVLQQQAPDRKPVQVATIHRGFGFGEEALISKAPRNATVKMQTNGLLVRLASEDFNTLLEKPKLKWFSPMQAQHAIDRGKAAWLDVRAAEKHANGTLEGAHSAPLSQLRDVMQDMDRKTQYICFCETTRQSATAAYLLDQIGFSAAVLRGGLEGLQKMRRGGLLNTTFQITEPATAPAADAAETAKTPEPAVKPPPRRGRKGPERREAIVGRAWKKLVARADILNGLPEDSLAEIPARLESVKVASGDVVIRQGDPADAFYIIVRGKATVTQQQPGETNPRQVAKLGKGDAFGEEGLLSRRPRNASVTMTGRGELMRMGADDFAALLEKPKLKWYSPIQVKKAITQLDAVLLDVREQEAFDAGTVEEAVSLPLSQLRESAARLDTKTTYICVCETSQLSASAAFLLRQKGLKAGALRGGLEGLRAMRDRGLMRTMFAFTGEENTAALVEEELAAEESGDWREPQQPETEPAPKKRMPTIKLRPLG